jgi:glycosyltransferase involved in cell wall biosynthesis
LPVEEDPCMSIIVPTLNEEKHIKFLLGSIKDQSSVSFETLIVDGGSRDGTANIARQHNAKVVVLPGYGEFVSRNVGAKIARGKLLLFTCADIVFPEGLFRKIIEKFEKNPELIALTGSGHPFDAPILGKIEYAAYNIVRYILSRFPKPFKRFSTSTNFLVVRRDYFEKTGGFDINDINADGLTGRRLLELGEVGFFFDTYVHISARRMKNMGFLDFNKHYLYVFENYFFFLSNTRLLKTLKHRSKTKHREIHEIRTL